MALTFKPNGTLNVATSPSKMSELDMVRCKNMVLDRAGIITSRKGHSKVHDNVTGGHIKYLVQQDGSTYIFSETNDGRGDAIDSSGIYVGEGIVFGTNVETETTRITDYLNELASKEYVTGSGINTFWESNYLYFGAYKSGIHQTSNDLVFRFPVHMDQGGIIKNAYLTLTAINNGVGSPKYRIYGMNEDNAIMPSRILTPPAAWILYEARERTTSFVDWEPEAFTAESEYNTPSIDSVMNEILSRENWVHGNHMVITVQDYGSAYTDNYNRLYRVLDDPTKATLLTYKYETN